MMDYEFRNARFNSAGTVDLEWNHPVAGWVPFTAAPDDVMDYGCELFEAARDGAAPYVPPPPDEIRASMPQLSSRQFWLAAASIGITKAGLVTLVGGLDLSATDAEMMTIELTESTSFVRLNPAILDLAIVLDIPAEQLDDLWIWASGI